MARYAIYHPSDEDQAFLTNWKRPSTKPLPKALANRYADLNSEAKDLAALYSDEQGPDQEEDKDAAEDNRRAANHC